MSGLYESKVVRKFIDDLRDNSSFLYEANIEPDYITNVVSKNIYTGLNMIIVNQAMKDKMKKAKFVITEHQLKHHNLYLDENEETVCSAIFENYKAKYKKNDYEVVKGQKSVGERRRDKNGNEVPLFFYSPLYSTEDVYRAKFNPEFDEKGKAKIYSEDQFAYEEDGQVMRYKKSYSYVTCEGKTIYINKGDPIVIHKKGEVYGKYEKSDVTVYATEPKIAPAFNPGGIVPLYKRRDESGREILIEKMTEAFRGKLIGNYKGLEISDSEIDAIEREFISHPRLFCNAIKQSQTRARGDLEEVRRMDENILRRQKNMSNFNSNSNSVTYEQSFERGY